MEKNKIESKNKNKNKSKGKNENKMKIEGWKVDNDVLSALSIKHWVFNCVSTKLNQTKHAITKHVTLIMRQIDYEQVEPTKLVCLALFLTNTC